MNPKQREKLLEEGFKSQDEIRCEECGELYFYKIEDISKKIDEYIYACSCGKEHRKVKFI